MGSRRADHKILGIVDKLYDAEALGVTELADQLGIAKSTAHYHLETLQTAGYVVQDEDGYRLSLRFLRIGQSLRNRIPVYDAAVEEVDKLAKETDELAILMVEEQGLGVYLYKAAGQNAIDIDAPIGRFASLHNRALGKAILAYLDRDRVEEILDEHGLSETTDRTITDREELFEEIEQIRAEEIAINREEAIEGLHGIAVPILDNTDAPIGAISIAGPSKRLEENKLTEKYADLLSRSRNIIELNVHHQNFQA